MASRTIDVDRLSAAAADQVVVIIANPVLVEGRRTRGLNAPNQPLFDEHPKRIVDRLPGNRTNAAANILRDGIRRAMRPLRYRPQHRQALGRHRNAILAKKVSGLDHGNRISPVLDSVQNILLRRINELSPDIPFCSLG